MASLCSQSLVYSLYFVKSSGVIIPIGLFMSTELSSITSKCLTLHLNIISTAVDGDDLESMVIRGEDIMLLFVTSLVRTSLIHTFLTKSRSVTRPIGLPSVLRTSNELTFLSFIFFAVSCIEADSSIVSTLFFIRSLTVSVIIGIFVP